MNDLANINSDIDPKALFPQPDDLTFRVATRPLAIVGSNGQHRRIESHKAIVRMDPANPKEPLDIGVVGHNYKLLSHTDYFDQIDKVIVESFLRADLEGAYVQTSLGYNGSYAKREYLLPALSGTVETQGVDSKLGYRALAWNSYDGSTSAGLLTGLIDWYCENGMIAGSFIGKKLRKHTAGLDLDLFTPTLQASVQEMYEQIEQFRAMAKIEVDVDKVQIFLSKECKMSPRLSEHLYDQFLEEVAARGRTAWAVYSALTYWSSHGNDANSNRFAIRATGNDNEAATLHQREMKVSSVVHGMDWQRLAA